MAGWFGEDKTSGKFVSEDQSAAVKIASAVISIDDENDPALEGHENDDGWTDNNLIFLNMTSQSFKHKELGQKSGAFLPLLVRLRGLLTHEFVHFIAEERDDLEIFKLIAKQKLTSDDFEKMAVKSFKVYF